MAHLSGTFSDPEAGRLVVTLSGTFYQDAYRDAGFPGSTGGEGNILIRAYVGPSGDHDYTEPIDRYAPVSVFELDYPGGSVSWQIGTEEVAHQHPTTGLWSYGMANLRLTAVLRVR